MKRLFLAIVALSMPMVAQQKPIFTQGKIQQATVYFTGVDLTHTASANIPKGTSELVIKNVANSLSEETIRVLAPSNVTVLSVQFTSRYMEEYQVEKIALLSSVYRIALLSWKNNLRSFATNAIQKKRP